MGRYCFGAFLKVLKLCSPKSATQKNMCGTMFMSINSQYDIRTDDSTVSRLLSCKDNVSPDVTDHLSVADNLIIHMCFEKEIIPMLYHDKYKTVIWAIRDIVENDKSIDDAVVIGGFTGKTKGQYRTQTDFVISDFLTDYFLFSLQGNDNVLGASTVKNINESYIDRLNAYAEKIKLLSVMSSPVLTIPKTIKGKDFDGVFKEVSNSNLGLINSEDYRIFRLSLEDYEFTYESMEKFLKLNLGRYVHSRAQMEKFRIDDELESVGIEAARLLRENYTGNELGEMLLYSFLEEILQAPKLMSKIELGQNANNCDGIHLYTIDGANPSYQMVFGTSHIYGNLQSAIDNAFDSVVEIKKSKPTGMQIVNSNVFNCTFPDTKTTEQVKSIILPSKNKQDPPATAFGLFLGYTIHMNSTEYLLPMQEFKSALIRKLEADIANQVTYITAKINSLGLQRYSFYIYVLPFNDADNDKTAIITDLIGGAVS